MPNRIIATGVLALLVGGPSMARGRDEQPASVPRQLARMTPEEFDRSATLKDDDLETVATITTRGGWQKKDGLLGIVNDDDFFRAFIDKRTGRASFQVYHIARYREFGWARFKWVNYETASGLHGATVKPLGRIRESCRKYTGCLRVEHVGFDVTEALLRDVARRFEPGRPGVWRYRLKAQAGLERDALFTTAEIAGMLRAVDRYRASKGFDAR